jgi:hypothetical protein
VNGSVGAT